MDQTNANRVPLSILGEIRSPQPIRFGVPLPATRRAKVPSFGQLVAADEVRRAQIATLRRWPDRSVQWFLVETILLPGDHDRDWILEWTPQESAPVSQRNDTSGTGDSYTLDLGTRSLDFAGQSSVGHDVQSVVGLGRDAWVLRDERADLADLETKGEPTWTANGPIGCQIQQRFAIPRLPHLSLHVQWSVYPPFGLVGCEATLRNSRRAKHPGNTWDLGDAGSQTLREFSFQLAPLAGESKLGGIGRVRLDSSDERAFTDQLKIHQHASGGANWNGRNHLDADGRIPLKHPGFTGKLDNDLLEGKRASPVVSWETKGSRFSAGVVDFWQSFPNSIGWTDDRLSVGLFPNDAGMTYELQGGEQVTKRFWLRWTSPKSATTAMEDDPYDLHWIDEPARVHLPPDFVAAAGVTPPTQPNESAAYSHFLKLMHEALDGPRSIEVLRERQDEFGWRNYGETVADHEEVFYEGSEEFVSHYNNQFDVLLGLLRQYLRTGNRRWFDLGESLARHVIDIDIYHTDEDRSVYNHGLFWFTDHYLTAHTCTHRTFSRLNRTQGQPYGGGPGPEHNYAEGLLLYHELTGSKSARKTVIGLADWVIAMEDASQTPFGIVDDLPTGKATLGFSKPSRGGANSISVLMDGWRLAGRDHYRTFAEDLIQRCIHPDDDIDALDLLNIEKNWSYTMFLSSMDKYLRAMEEAGKRDGLYDYTRLALIRYAEWMLHHERPYLDHRDQLEYPTEAWPAQEMRKSNVMRKAARYADPGLRVSLLARAGELSDRSWDDLMSFTETRTTIRTLALVMNEGLTDCVLRGAPPEPIDLPPPRQDFPPRQTFHPQKTRLKQMLTSPRGLLTIASRSCSPARWQRWCKAKRNQRELQV